MLNYTIMLGISFTILNIYFLRYLFKKIANSRVEKFNFPTSNYIKVENAEGYFKGRILARSLLDNNPLLILEGLIYNHDNKIFPVTLFLTSEFFNKKDIKTLAETDFLQKTSTSDHDNIRIFSEKKFLQVNDNSADLEFKELREIALKQDNKNEHQVINSSILSRPIELYENMLHGNIPPMVMLILFIFLLFSIWFFSIQPNVKNSNFPWISIYISLFSINFIYAFIYYFTNGRYISMLISSFLYAIIFLIIVSPILITICSLFLNISSIY